MTLQSTSTLSVCMIARNEAGNIEKCLKSVKSIADEIIVVDTGSEDTTIALAEQNGAKVVCSPWRNDFSYSRNISLRNAHADWILWLDADDVVPADSLPQILRLKKEKPDKVFGMVVRNQKPNGTGTEFIQARMFPNHPDIYFERPVHEQMMPSALRLGMSMVTTPVVIEHHGYAFAQDMKSKAQRNISLLLGSVDESRPDPVLFIEIADSYAIAGREDQAENWYRKVIDLPIDKSRFAAVASQAYVGMGNILNRQNQYTQAREYFIHAFSLCPQRTDALYSQAVSEEMLGRKQQAVSLLERILAMEPSAVMVGVDFRQARIKSYMRLGRLLRELNMKDELGKLCIRGLQEFANRQEIQNMAGVSYYYLGNLVKALHCFERSLKIIVDGNLDAYIGLCSIYCKAGQRVTAEQTIRSIQPLFGTTARYRAFCEVYQFFDSTDPVPPNLTREEIDAEKESLRKVYLQ